MAASPKYSETTDISQWFSPPIVDLNSHFYIEGFIVDELDMDYTNAVIDYSILNFLRDAINARGVDVISKNGVKVSIIDVEDLLDATPDDRDFIGSRYLSLQLQARDDWIIPYKRKRLTSFFDFPSSADDSAQLDEYLRCVQSVKKSMMSQLLKMDTVFRQNALAPVTFQMFDRIYRIEGYYVELSSSDEYIKAAMAEIEAEARKLVSRALNQHTKMQGMTLRVSTARKGIPRIIDNPWGGENVRSLILEIAIAKWSAASATERFRPPLIPDTTDKILRAVELIIEYEDRSAQCDEEYRNKRPRLAPSLLRE